MKYLEAQLESLENQSHLPFELQVGDDGSTDDTLKILTSFATRAPFSVNIHRNDRRLGFGNNFLATAERCKGEWVAFSDQDDFWKQQKLKRCSDALEKAGCEVNLLMHAYTRVNGSLEFLANVIEREEGVIRRDTINMSWAPGGFQQVFRRSMMTQVPFARHTMPWFGFPDAHDVRIWIIAHALGDVLYIAEPLVLHRRHGANTTSDFVHPDVISSHFQGAIANNRDQYLQVSSDNSAMSKMLAEIAADGLNESQSIFLQEAAEKTGRLSSRLSQRADLYGSKSFGRRASAMKKLVSEGAYTSSVWGLGRKAAIKDLTFVLFGDVYRQTEIKKD